MAAQNLPINFAIPAEGSVASYSFSELLSGSGYVEFYLGLNDTGMLTEFQYYSKTSLTEYSSADNNSVWTSAGSLDFKQRVNKPVSVAGKAVATIPTWKSNNSSTGVRCVVSIGKYDGVTTTILASGTTNQNGQSTAEVYKYLTAEIDVPKTNFKIGEYLVVRVETYVATEQTTSYFKIGHDPSNQSLSDTGSSGVAWNSSTLSKSARCVIPFEVEV